MRAIYVPLGSDEKAALFDFARREDRDPRFQAARFVREGLERAGVLTDQEENATAGSPVAQVPA